MTKVSEIMSTDVQVVEPQQSLQRAARLMQQREVGALPVCDGERLLGMLTDRDITIRGVAEGLDGDKACVADVMSEGIAWCTADQSVEDIMKVMANKQIRRIPVVDAQHRLVGIVAVADLARRQKSPIDETMREISGPDKAAP